MAGTSTVGDSQTDPHSRRLDPFALGVPDLIGSQSFSCWPIVNLSGFESGAGLLDRILELLESGEFGPSGLKYGRRGQGPGTVEPENRKGLPPVGHPGLQHRGDHPFTLVGDDCLDAAGIAFPFGIFGRGPGTYIIGTAQQLPQPPM